MMYRLFQLLFVAVAVGLGVNSVISNYMYGVTMGAGFMSHVYGVGGAGVDVFKTALPTLCFLVAAAPATGRQADAIRAAKRMLPVMVALFIGLTGWSLICSASLQAQTVADKGSAVSSESSCAG